VSKKPSSGRPWKASGPDPDLRFAGRRPAVRDPRRIFGRTESAQGVEDALIRALDRVIELERTLAVERTRREMAEKQLAVKQTEFDWLRLLYNRVAAESAALLKARGVDVGFAETIHPDPTAQTSVGDPQNVARDAGDDLDPEAYSGLVNNFEDVGDKMAAELGIEHDDAGLLKQA